jgi:hypothetical protein
VKLSNKIIKTQLEKNTEFLGQVFGWDGEIKPYFWEIAEKGELTAEKILLENKFQNIPSLETVSLDKYVDWLATTQKKFGGLRENKLYLLTEILDSNLVEFQIYQAYYLDDFFHLYLGKIDEIWFGLCETFPALDEIALYPDSYRTTSNKFSIPDVIVAHKAKTSFLIEELRRNDFSVTNKFSSDDDIFMWDCAESKSLLIEKLLTLARFITRFEFSDLANLCESVRISGDPTGLEKKLGLIEKYQNLEQYLQRSLTEQQAFVIGPPSESDFELYVLGRDRDNDWAGVFIHVGLLS